MTEEKKIQEIILKYKDFIQSSCADITTSIKGKRYFYLIDEKSEEINSIVEFNTAEELEQIIVHEMADALNLVIEVVIENLNFNLTKNLFLMILASLETQLSI